MFQALGTCRNVQDFENLLDSTNVTGRRTASDFGVIDSEGNAAIYETGGDQYWKYDGKKDEPCIDLRPIENIRIDPAADWLERPNLNFFCGLS